MKLITHLLGLEYFVFAISHSYLLINYLFLGIKMTLLSLEFNPVFIENLFFFLVQLLQEVCKLR